MEKVIYGSKMKKVDRYTIDIMGIPSMVLMERAAYSVFMEIKNNKDNNKDMTKRFLCLCGMGNNGADGLAIARMLKLAGYITDVIVIGNEEKATDEWQSQKKIAKNCDLVVENICNYVAADEQTTYTNIRKKLKEYDYIVDSIFGIGLTRNVEGIYAQVIDAVNDEHALRNKKMKPLEVYAVDVPSGLCADTGNIMGTAIYADKTVTFGMMKTGLLLYKGKDISGEVVVADIGFPDKAYKDALAKDELCMVHTAEDILKISKRKKHSNKGTYGKLAVIAGSENMYGAAYFTAKAALQLGTGLVKIITHENNRNLIYEDLPEVMIETYKNDTTENEMELLVKNTLNWCDVIVIGPGLSKSREARLLLKYAMEQAYLNKKHIVIDADGLNIIAENETLKEYYHEKTVITPHIGEASRLTGLTSAEIAKDIIGVTATYAGGNRINVVQKDCATVILGIESCVDKCNNRICINTSGNPGMATGGSGDVLAGMIGAVLAGGIDIDKLMEAWQFSSSDDLTSGNVSTHEISSELVLKESEYDKTFLATAMAVYIHGLAGNMAANEMGETSMTATDILKMIPKCLVS